MFNLIKELFAILTPSQRRRYFSLQIMVVLMAIVELFGIASIGPFMALVADVELIKSNRVIHEIYIATGVSSAQGFLFISGMFVLTMLSVASLLSMYTTWRLSLFSFSVGTEIGDRLYKHYLNKNWLFHASGSSAQLTKQISTEAVRVTTHIIKPIMDMNARLVMAFFISLGITIYNPVVALIGVSLFVVGYVIIYKVIREKIARYGKDISHASTKRFRLMNEGFGGVKDVLLYDRSEDFIEQFQESGKVLARAQGVNQALSAVPRYFMELLAFGILIILILVLLKMHDGALEEVLPVLAIYALAGFKLLPAFQQIYGSITTVRGNIAAFDSIKTDLKESKGLKESKDKNLLSLNNVKNIRLKDVFFTYPGKENPAINGININIPINGTVGFVGESGSGKSTAIDLLLALINPGHGSLMLDNIVVDESNRKSWQKNIGFVPQSIFLSEGSIAENVAFGLNKKDIDINKVEKAIKLAHLEKLIIGLPRGLETKVGERGIQLSGGQRQRIGIARALYDQADVLVFDEATSALDGITEKVIMDAIQELSGHKTIILIAHRLKTVKKCDVIYMMENGKVIAEGCYDELILSNDKFRKMTQYS